MDRRHLRLVAADEEMPVDRSASTLPANPWNAVGLRISVLEAIDCFIDQVRRHDDCLGGDSLTKECRLVLETVSDLLDQPGSSTWERELYGLACELTRLLGWSAYDSKRHGLAQRHLLVALRASQQAHRPDLAANILDGLASVALAMGSPQDAANLVQAALMGAGHLIGPAGRAALYSELIRSLAASGDVRAVAAVHDRMFEQLARLGSDPPPRHLYWMDATEANCWAGFAYFKIGYLRRAEEYLRAGIDSLPLYRRRDGVLWLATLSRVHLQQGEVEVACRAGARCLDLLAGLESPRATAEFSIFRRELRRHSSNGAVRDLESHAIAILGAA